MRETIIMTRKAQVRAKLMEMISRKKMTQKEASEKLGISLRQTKRIYKKYKNHGDEALNHGLLGTKGNHHIDIEFRNTVIELIKEKYKGFKPTFIAEKLLELESIKVNL